MNVKIPEAPRHYSKAAVSTRQVATVKPRGSGGGGSTTTHTGITQQWAPLDRQQARALLINADLLLDSDLGDHADDDSCVGRDRGREREMCSSPRFHSAVQDRLREVGSSEQRRRFVHRIVDEEHLLTPRQFGTDTPTIGVPLSLLQQQQQGGGGGSADGLQQSPSTSAAPVADGAAAGAGIAARPPTAPSPRQSSSRGNTTKARPMSCFASTSLRFVTEPSTVPPVGHYNVRYSVVDAEPKRSQLPKQQLQGEGAMSLDCTMTLSSPMRGTRGGSTAAAATTTPGGAQKSDDPLTAEKRSDDANGEDTAGVHASPAAESAKAKPQKPSSAFASRVPQLLSLAPRVSAYRSDLTFGLSNESALSTNRSPRGIVPMSRGSTRADGSPSGEGAKASPRSSSTFTAGQGSGAPVIYDIDRGMKVAARPTGDGRLTTESAPGANIDFGRMVGRDIHVTDGMKFATFANPAAEGDDDLRRRHRLSENDPVRDGTSLDYLTISHPSLQATPKGQLYFGKQVSRKQLHSATPLYPSGSADELVSVQYPDPHQSVVNFSKMHKPSPYNTKSACRLDGYEVQYPQERIPEVVFERGGSHSDHRSTFYRVAAAPTVGDDTAAETAAGDPTPLTHPKTTWNIDLAKLRPRETARAAAAGGSSTDRSQRSGAASGSSTARLNRESAGRKKSLVFISAKTLRQENLKYTSADIDLINSRVKGNPFLGRHLSRQERNKRLEPKPIATSDRNYTVENGTMRLDAEKVMAAPSALSFDAFLARDQKGGGRLSAEYGLEPVGPGPCAYTPHLNRYGLQSNISPPRSAQNQQRSKAPPANREPLSAQH